MITNEIYFFKNQTSTDVSNSLYNVNDGTLVLQVDGDVKSLELSVLGNTDLIDDNFVTLKVINASDYSVSDKISAPGIYWIDINAIRSVKVNLSKISGSVNVKGLTKRGLTTDLVARAMAANSSGGGSYTLPTASANTLGGIKIGDTLNISNEGVANINTETIATKEDIENTYPIKLYTELETIDKMKETTITYGNVETAATNSVTSVGTFWMTNCNPNIVGNKLKSVKINGITNGGTITFRGNNSITIDKTNSSMNYFAEQAKLLNDSSDTKDIFTITVTAGAQTYLLDGTDNRVTILNQNMIDNCPLTLGVAKTTDTSYFKFNKGNLTNEGYIRFCHSGSATDSLAGERTSGLGIEFSYLVQTIESKNVTLKLELNDGTILETPLSEVDMSKIKSSLYGKKISILGDSISTYNGYIPSGYATFYPANNITNVEQTWWKSLIDETGMELVANASWSGSYVTGDSTSTTNGLAGCSTARINALASESKPEIIIIYIGINDFAQSVHRELGNYTGQTAIPNEGTITTFSDAYGLMVKKVLTAYPNAKVYCCTLLETRHSNFDTQSNGTYPVTNNNNVTLSEFNNRIKEIATNLGAKVIDLHSCGINYWNVSQFTGDLLHPNSDGAKLIMKSIKNKLENDF